MVVILLRSRKPRVFDYLTDGNSLSNIDTFKDLGVDISTKLDWNVHDDIELVVLLNDEVIWCA